MVVQRSELSSLPFDQYQRYRIVERVVNQLRPRLGKAAVDVLDVGGHYRDIDGNDFPPIAGFLPDDRALALDVAECVMPGYLRGDGRRMPFQDGAFDVVVSCDTLEHVAAGARASFVAELVRGARSCVVLIAPFDSEETRLAERVLFDYVRLFYGHEQEQLLEHRELGLPRQAAVRKQLDEMELPFVDFPSGHLHRWLLMMVLKHNLYGRPGSSHLHQEVDRFYNCTFDELDDRTPAYRHVFVVSLNGDQGFLQLVARDFVRARVREDAGLAGQLAAQSQTIAGLSDSVARLERQVAQLQTLMAQSNPGRDP